MKEISIEELLHKGCGNLIDVRSPAEYARDTIPGACNVPLFSDEERAQVGITYKQEGQAAAQWLGMQIVAPKMERLMRAIRERAEETSEVPTIFCWRGGMRSKAMATFASFSGLPVQRLIGGYRAYRKHVVHTFEPYQLHAPVVLLHGLTGVGKTELLRRLEERGLPVLDLERMAGHRGSVFGHIGYGKPANQKMFDARLFETLRQYPDAPFFLMEAESRRIGNALLPPFLMEAKQTAYHLFLRAPLDVRVERLYADYVAPYAHRSDFRESILQAYRTIAGKIPTEQSRLLAEAIKREDYRQAITSLLLYYYDPRYQNKRNTYTGPFTEIDATSLEAAEAATIHFLKATFTDQKIYGGISRGQLDVLQ
ncbi:tRNA 2-selenouridine(34) synthase MnmH [Brevibacillus humidisoli]|uniref:tRNA 2-selenouridine(34) synthase MnmH n=1 Tax=Brevibacillus humidisoli TaxID=2895522 RepID=UPI001E54AA44|nr:tRNA 2-selenouridine(34) synthase MnmH [Brevibacillus humidisoli]UFJ40236.1 tRNA 2-selenouridine(34) synthase MnmH [Brevibacillus humidisoli]